MRSKGSAYSGTIVISMKSLTNINKFSEHLIFKCIIIDTLYRFALSIEDKKLRDTIMGKFDKENTYFFPKGKYGH
jgi:hypothetical protein